MALQNIINDLSRQNFTALKQAIVDDLGSKEVTEIKITRTQYASKMNVSFRRAVIAGSPTSALPKVAASIPLREFETALDNTLAKEMITSSTLSPNYYKTSTKDVYVDISKTTSTEIFFLVVANSAKSRIKTYMAKFNNKVFAEWYDNIASVAVKGVAYKQKKGSRAPDFRDDLKGQGQNAPYGPRAGGYGGILGAHEYPTTSFHLWLRNEFREAVSEHMPGGMGLSGISAEITIWAMSELLMDQFNITWDPEIVVDPVTGLEDEIRIVRIHLADDNPSNPLDIVNKENALAAMANIIGRLGIFIDPLSTKVKTSHPYSQRQSGYAKAYLMKQLIEKHKKRGIVIKQKKQKFQKPKPGTIKKRKIYRPKKEKLSLAVRGTRISKAVEKGQGKQASTSQAADLARLKKYIQGRLPAEVRRNMGRPVLQNRTGRFSNSVQLLSLTEAQNTIMAKYTYLLSPYETFENKGKKRWPMAYNPKPLIAKSIRNLAQGRIEQKLTVRRV